MRKKRVTATYKFTDLRSKLTPQASFLGVWGQRLKQEQRKKMGGSEKRRLADCDGHLFTNFPLGSNPCSLRRIHPDSAGAGLSQLREKGPCSFAKQPKSMSLRKTRSKSQSPDKLSLKKKKRGKKHTKTNGPCFSFSSHCRLIKSKYITEMKKQTILDYNVKKFNLLKNQKAARELRYGENNATHV